MMSRKIPPPRRTSPRADAERLGHRDLDVVDVTPVPERLEEAVAERKTRMFCVVSLPR